MIKYKDLTPEQIQGAKEELRELVKYVVSEKLIPDLEEPEVKEEPTFPAYTERIEDSEIVKAYKRFKQSRTHKTAEERVYWLLEADHKMIELLANGDKEAALAYITEDKGRSMNTDIALISFDDYEREEPFTINLMDFYEMLIESVNKKDSDRAAYEMLGILVTSFKTFAETDGNIPDPELKKEFIELLDKLSWILQQDAGGDKLEKFLKGEQKFMVIPRAKGMEDLLKINSPGHKGPVKREYKNARISFSGQLSIDEHKIGEMVRLAFTSQNPHKAKTGLNTEVILPLTEVMRTLGRSVNPNNRKEFIKTLRTKTLPNLNATYIEIREDNGTFERIYFGGGYYKVEPRKDRIIFTLSDVYALYLNTNQLSQYSYKTLRLGSQRNPLPFYLALKIQNHYYHDGNRRRSNGGTHNLLSIKTLLEFCEDSIPSYEYVQEKDPGHWIRRIREPLEKALNEMQKTGFLEWGYCKAGLAEATEKEIATTDYRKWSRLYITFRLLEEPDQTQRLEHKQQRIEAAQTDRVLKRAEKIIKADQIERRNRRRKKKDQ